MKTVVWGVFALLALCWSALIALSVQLADWLGSDTREGFFPYSQPGEDRATTAPHRSRHALRAIGNPEAVSLGTQRLPELRLGKPRQTAANQARGDRRRRP